MIISSGLIFLNQDAPGTGTPGTSSFGLKRVLLLR